MLYYLYCVKMKMSERNYWDSPLKKILKLLDMYQDEVQMKMCGMQGIDYTSKYFENEIPLANSMRQILGG